MTEKFQKCITCGETFPLTKEYFKKAKNAKSGLSSQCIICIRAHDRKYSRDYRLAHPEWKEMDNKRSRTKQMELKKEYDKKYPERVSARGKVGYATRTGKLVKRPCVICGAVPALAHHEDYSKPLEVIYLCPLHHKAIHSMDLEDGTRVLMNRASSSSMSSSSSSSSIEIKVSINIK